MVINSTTFLPINDQKTTYWTGKTGTDNWAMVDDATPDDDKTYVWTSGASALDVYGKTATAFTNQNIQIEKIEMVVRARRSALHTYNVMIKLSTDAGNGIPQFPVELTYGTYTATYPWADSSNRTPWTKSNIDLGNIHISCNGSNNSVGGIRATQCYMTVYWQYAIVPGYGRVTWTP